MKSFLLGVGVVAAIGLFLLASASADTALFARNYPLLLAINATLAALLASVVAYQLVVFARRYRARVFGTRLTLRLLSRFALLAVVPGLLVYTVSVQFLARSVESWFDVKVDAALEGGITLGQQAIDQMLTELQTKGRSMALELAERPQAQQVVLLNQLREQGGVAEAVLVTGTGRLLASASDDVSRLVPELPNHQNLRQVRASRMFSTIESPAGRRLSLRVIVAVDPVTLGDEGRFLQLRRTLPANFSRSAEAVEAAYRDYRQLALSREGLKRIYIVTLTFALLMALIVAVGVAAAQSNQIAAPLANLAQATQAVARGDFSRQTPVISRDELGVLTESFNSMTRQLGEARRVVEANRVELEGTNARLENILANLSAGVLVFDHALVLATSNSGAARILGDALKTVSGRRLQDWQEPLAEFARALSRAFTEPQSAGWPLEIALQATGKTLLARGSTLPASVGGGYVLVFDDITQVIQAQRATAWAEVARRLAHEIKNPLTPIQLSAERVEAKLATRLDAPDADILRRATQTIVSQVSALKSMVDEFGDYARLPRPQLAPLDLNALVEDILELYATAKVPVNRVLEPALPAVRADAGQIRQLIHNLIRNAQDAVENRPDAGSAGWVMVRTSRDGAQACLTISDTGSGFPQSMMTRVFEPYVTTKPRGTGLGLAIVKKIVDEHHGTIGIENRPGEGATVRVTLPIASSAPVG